MCNPYRNENPDFLSLFVKVDDSHQEIVFFSFFKSYYFYSFYKCIAIIKQQVLLI